MSLPRASTRVHIGTALVLAALLALASLGGLTACSKAESDASPTTEPAAAVHQDDGEAASDPLPDTSGAAPEPQADNPADGENSTIKETATPAAETAAADDPAAPLDYRTLPAYEGSPYVYVNDGEPSFTEAERSATPGTERYDELDHLGRCTDAFAVVGPETQPTEKRGSIGSVKPTGWRISKYDFVDGKYLFNRCHLLGYQLTGENANERNLITGTRYLNVDGMLPFENAVDDYVDATGNHVLMRVTPLFHEDELVARGVHMQAESIEDDGDGISFNVYCYNVQPGVVIDYATGENMLAEDATPLPDVSGAKDSGSAAKADEGGTSAKGNAGANGTASKGQQDYVLNTNSKKFHVPSCSSVKQMAAKNREDVKDTRENLLNRGYDPCKRCNP